MTRLIDADALKKAFEDCTGECACCIHNTNDFDYCGLIDDAPTVERLLLSVFAENADEKAVADLKAELQSVIEAIPQGRWIPVTERLPDENGEYLVTREAYIDRENRNMIFVIDIARFTITHDLNNGFHKVNTVIAWQPLPELYKEGGAE